MFSEKFQQIKHVLGNTSWSDAASMEELGANNSRWVKIPIFILIACIVGMAIALSLLFSPHLLNPDTAQYVVTARHLVRGDGFATSLLYYEEQMVSGTIPAPQTIWPPGYPMLIACLLVLGVPSLHAPFILALTSHAMAFLLLYLILWRISHSSVTALMGALAWYLAILPNVLVLRGLTETTYVLCTLLGAIALSSALQTGSSRRRWLALASVAAAGAFLIRYIGITYVATLGTVLGLRFLRYRSRTAWWDFVISMIIPCIVISSLSLRNWFLVGKVTGGPSLGQGSSVWRVIQNLVWALQQVVGIYDDPISIWLRIGVFSLLLWLFLEFLRSRWRRVQLNSCQLTQVPLMAWFGVAYIGWTLGFLVFLGFQQKAEAMLPRYFLPLLPFFIIIIVKLLTELKEPPTLNRMSWGRKHRGSIAGACLFLLFFAAQVNAIALWKNWLFNDQRFSIMIKAMGDNYNGKTVSECILEKTPTGTLLLPNGGGQLLGLYLDRPTIGLTSSEYSSRIWDLNEVRRLVMTYDIRLVCLFPTIIEADSKNERHRIFFQDLARGELPEWLRLFVETPLVKIYEVIPDQL